MRIDFDRIGESVQEHFKGGEGTFCPKMYTDEHNKIMYARLLPHSSIGLHTHEGNSEVIFILSGSGKVLYEGEYISLKAGDCHYCPMGCSHSLINDTDADLTLYAVVAEHRV